MTTENVLELTEEKVELYRRLTDDALILLAQSPSDLDTEAELEAIKKTTQPFFVLSWKDKIQSLHQTLWVLDEMNGNEKVIQGIHQILQTLNNEEQAEILEKLVQHCITEYTTL